MISIIPRSFFFVAPLQIGAEIVAACAILNKVSALYGLGALFTGHPLTVMQWVMNLLAVAVFPVAIFGWLSIYNRRPLRVLVFTYVYTIDTFVSLGFTIYFIVYWFTKAGKAANNGPGAPTQTVSMVAREAPTNVGYGSSEAASLNKSMSNGQEIAMTVVATTVFLLMRFYFMLVLIGYARLLCRKTNLRSSNGEPNGSWAARLQYILIAPLEKFWTGQSRNGRRERSRSFGPAETERLTSRAS